MSKIKILIVEDEILIAETIKLYLEEYDYIVADICISYDEAIEKYHLHSPDIVLLDIRLFGDKSGIDVAKYLQEQKNKTPYIYLTSQYDKRVLETATKTIPYGYITKPFAKETLWTSISAAYQLHKSKNEREPKIEVYDGKATHLISPYEIIYIESEHVYTKYVLINSKDIFSRTSLEKCEETLSSEIFFRCHRSFIINLQHIKSWDKEEVKMSNDTVIPVSRSKKDELKKVVSTKQ